MLEKIENPAIVEQSHNVDIAREVTLHAVTLRHEERAGRIALYLHGSGTAGNHTIVERPSHWLIDRGCYDTVVLPDRWGCGTSSPWTRKPTLCDQAQDMKALLDALAVQGPVDVLGLSTGGPIALVQAHVDDRYSWWH